MRSKLRLSLLLTVMLFLSQLKVFSQCPAAGLHYPITNLTPTLAAQTIPDAFAGDYSTYNVVAGNTYLWSLCAADGGVLNYDGELTLYNNANLATFIVFSDDECGANLAPFIEWTATFTGVARIRLTEYQCLSNEVLTTLVYQITALGGAAPSNDNCANATNLTVGSFCIPVSGTTQGATASTTAACVGTPTDDVWYRIIATSSSDIIIDLIPNGIGFDGVMEVFVGNSCAGLTSIDCIDGFNDGVMETVGVTGLTAGTVLYVRVYDYFSAAALNPFFSICVYEDNVGSATGDECANAVALPINFTCTPSNFNFDDFTTSVAPAGSCAGTVTSDVWYAVTAPVDGTLFLNFDPIGQADPAIEAFVGTCGTLTSFGCLNAGANGVTEETMINNVVGGETYYIRVYDIDGNTAVNQAFTACAFLDPTAPGPINNECAGAQLILAGTTCVEVVGTLQDASASLPVTTCAGTNTEDVWYEIVAGDTAVTVDITPFGPNVDLVFEVFDGECNTLGTLGCVDATVNGEAEGINVIGLTPGESIFIRVFDYNSVIATEQGFSICAYWNETSTPPSNDECAGAIGIAVGNGGICNAVAVSTLNASSSTPVSSCSPGGIVAADVWYSFVASSTSVNIVAGSVTGSDPVIQYFSGTCGALVSRGCSDFFVEGNNEQLSAIGLIIGQTYFVRIYDYRGVAATSTDFTLCVVNNAVPANNNCPTATSLVVSQDPAYFLSTTALATQSSAGCAGNANDDVWFSFVAAENPGGTLVQVGGDLDFAVVMQIYSGTCGALTSIQCVNDVTTGQYETESVTLTTLTPGQTYFVRVYDFDASVTNSTFYIVAAGTPAGCSLASPTATAGGSTALCGTATVQLSTPVVAGLAYLWQNNGLNIVGGTGSLVTASTAGSYTVIITDALGCSAVSNAISVTSTTPPAVVIQAGGSTTICGSGSVALSAPVQAGVTFQWMRDGINISGATGTGYSATQSGVYTVSGSSAPGCSGTSNAITVTVSANPTANVTAGGSTTICQGSSIVLSSGTDIANAIQWRLNGNPIAGANALTLSASQAGNYSVVVTNAANCSFTSNSINIIVVPGPNATASAAGSTTFCAGGSVSLSVPTVSGATYQWQNNGTAVGGAISATFVATTAGSFTVIVSTASCAATSNAISVIVNAAPDASVSAAGPLSFCQGGSVELTATTAGATYQWLNGGANISGATSASFTATATGSYSVVITQNGCSSTSAVSAVTSSPLPSATITPAGSTTVCQGNSVVLNGPSGSGFNYQWSLNGTPVSAATNASFTASTSGNYTLTVTAPGNCSSTSTAVNVNIIAAPSATVTAVGPLAICQGSSVNLNANTGTGLSYQWQINGATVAGATSQTFGANAAGNYTVVVSNTGGCSATSTITAVTVNPLPASTITPNGPTTFCVGGTVLLQGPSTPGLSYQWNLNGNPISGALNNVVIASQTGSFTLSVSDLNTCSSVSLPLQVNVAGAQATISLVGPPAVCDGNSVTLNANTGAGLIYQWQNNGSAVSGETGASFIASAAGNYSVVVTDPNNCVSTSAPQQISIGASPSAPVITADGDLAICEGEQLTLSAPAVGGITYTWEINGNPEGSVTIPSISPIGSGSFVLVASNAANCVASSNALAVTVNAVPEVSFSLTEDKVCENGTADIGGGIPSGGTFGGTGVSGTIFTAGAPGFTDIIYTFTNLNGCSGTAVDQMEVTALPEVVLAIEADTVCKDATITLTGGSPSGGIFSGNGVAGNQFMAAGSGDVTISYSFTDLNGCSASATDIINVDDCTFIHEVETFSVILYPNPADDFVIIELSSANSVQDLFITDAAGRIVEVNSRAEGANRLVLETGRLAAGAYQVVITVNGLPVVKRFIKTEK